MRIRDTVLLNVFHLALSLYGGMPTTALRPASSSGAPPAPGGGYLALAVMNGYLALAVMNGYLAQAVMNGYLALSLYGGMPTTALRPASSSRGATSTRGEATWPYL